LSSGYGLTPDDWQDDVLADWLGRRRDGRWVSATCGLAVPRQNGKNGIIEIRELFGMVALGEKFLHTAHEVKTARKAFLRIASFFENERQYPELAALVKEIRKTNGQEAIVLTNGGSCEFIARSKGSGRGFTVDILVCDEAQDLTDEELAALLPTISAAPLGNPQVILTGTPPDPEKGQTGEVFRRVRSDGEHRRDRRLAWTDFGIADGQLPDLDDKLLWEQVNPSLGGRLNVAEAERERKLMSPEMFARERLGWWGDPNVASSSAFGPGRWEACGDDSATPVVTAIGLAVSWDRKSASIGCAGQIDGASVVGAVERRDGAGWIVAEAKRIQGEHGCAVVVDERGPAADLITALEAAGVALLKTNTSDYLDACATLFDIVTEQSLTHPNHPDLDAAVAIAVKRLVGDRWAWGRRQSSGDISMLEAVTLANFGAVSGVIPTVW
jgi:phage terminase large subunit-like protein